MQHKLNLTENLRLSLFAHSNQEIWSIRAGEMSDGIAEMINNNQDLFATHEYAREKRREIARELRHTDQEDDAGIFWFGIIRDSGPFYYRDTYTPDKFAASDQKDDSLYKIMLSILAEQSASFSRKILTLENKWAYYEKNWPYGSIEKNKTIVEYKLHDKAEPAKVNVYYYKNADLKNGEWQEQPEIVAVCVGWGAMNKNIYKEKLTRLNPQLNEIKNSASASRDCLIKMGCLAHDLCRSVFYQRGSASVAGAHIRGIGKVKGFPGIGNMHVRGLPFDVYAQIQPDREKYAIEFCNDVSRDFNLLQNNELTLSKV